MLLRLQIIYCAAAKTAFTADLLRVDERGVAGIAKAMQDELFRRARAEGAKHSSYAKKEVADFGKIYHQLRWDIGFVGVQVGWAEVLLLQGVAVFCVSRLVHML
jgi:hypothetical protein